MSNKLISPAARVCNDVGLDDKTASLYGVIQLKGNISDPNLSIALEQERIALQQQPKWRQDRVDGRLETGERSPERKQVAYVRRQTKRKPTD